VERFEKMIEGWKTTRDNKKNSKIIFWSEEFYGRGSYRIIIGM